MSHQAPRGRHYQQPRQTPGSQDQDQGAPHQMVARTQTEAPPMPVVLPDTLWRSANLVYVPGGRHTIGWQDARKEGPSFVVARTSVMGEKILKRFPLTEDGWVQAWFALVRLDASAAEAVAGELEKKKAAYANQAAQAERRAKMQPFRALGVEVQAEPVRSGRSGVMTPGAEKCHGCSGRWQGRRPLSLMARRHGAPVAPCSCRLGLRDWPQRQRPTR
jgi:hypothetical protein